MAENFTETSSTTTNVSPASECSSNNKMNATTSNNSSFLLPKNGSNSLLETPNPDRSTNVMTTPAAAAGTIDNKLFQKKDTTKNENDFSPMYSNIPSKYHIQNMEEFSFMEQHRKQTDFKPRLSNISSQYQLNEMDKLAASASTSRTPNFGVFPTTLPAPANNGNNGGNRPQIYEIDSEYCIGF